MDKTPPSFGCVALIGKYQSAEVGESMRTLAHWLRDSGRKVLIEHDSADALSGNDFETAVFDEIGRRAGLAVVIGGDGSLISAARKLAPHAESPEQIEALLDDLQREGWLSDERFAQSLVHRRAPQRGTARVVQELKQYGLDADKVAELRDQMRATEYERALETWRKRFGEKPADRAAYAKQARFLTSRGFAHDVIRRILGEGDDES